MSLRREWFVVLLFAAAFLFRLGLVLTMRDIATMPAGMSSADDIEFNVLAKHVADGKGFTNHADRPTSFRAPGWPIFMAGVYKVSGYRPEAIYVTSCILGALTCVLAYLIGAHLLGERPGRMAGALCVVFVPHAYFATWFWSENLFVPLFALAVWVLVRMVPAIEGGGGKRILQSIKFVPITLGEASDASARPQATPRLLVGWVALAGLILGAAAITRPFALLAAPLFALVLLRYRGWRGFVEGAVLGLATALVVAPWTYRNYLVHERIVLVATNGGSTFYGGNNDLVVTKRNLYGSWVSTVELPGRAEIDAAPDEVSHDKVEWRLGWEWVKGHPTKALFTLPLKLARLIFWLPDFDGGSRLHTIIRAAIYYPFLLLILIGLWRGRREISGPGWWMLHMSMIATVLTAFLFWGSPRFRDANAPLLVVYCALAFLPRRRAEQPEPPLKRPDDYRHPSSVLL